MFNPSIGIFAYMARGLGYDWNHQINGNDALVLVTIAAVWKQISYNFLFFLAGLQAIPKSLMEAAAIDGASPWKRFWSITFPLLSPTTFFLLVVNVVYAFFDTFGVIHATTGGGPGQATNILVYKVYTDGFRRAEPRVLRCTERHPDGHRHRTYHHPVPLCRAAGPVLRGPSWSKIVPG